MSNTTTQEAFLRTIAERVIREFVEGVVESVDPRWLKHNEKARGIILPLDRAEVLAELIRVAKVTVTFPGDEGYDPEPDVAQDDELPECDCCDGFDSGDVAYFRNAA